jgi:hypothetical protein
LPFPEAHDKVLYRVKMRRAPFAVRPIKMRTAKAVPYVFFSLPAHGKARDSGSEYSIVYRQRGKCGVRPSLLVSFLANELANSVTTINKIAENIRKKKVAEKRSCGIVGN